MSFKVDPSFIPDKINFPKEEERVLEFWNDIKAFEKSSLISEGRPEFSFYDGPPFATGLPHYGHILAGTIKDCVTRYAYANGYHVVRRFGWDCHGLPVEHEIDKEHGITSPGDVMSMGIANYNAKCRSIVSRYATEWESIIGRLGRWIDFKNDYKTMYPSFMESVWWVFKQLFDKGLVYRGFRVMPFSTALSTPLSNFETSQNYKDVVDPSVIVRFPWVSDPSISFLAWTTTPWTLPGNLALVVHPDQNYLKILDSKTKLKFIIMESRISLSYPNGTGFEIIDKICGKNLVGIEYTPPFEYFRESSLKGSFMIIADSFVTEDAGTGIVHSAPAFGEDDLRVCRENGLIIDFNHLPCHVNECGRFISPAIDFEGLHFTEANSKIIKHLKQKGLITLHTQHKHNYPFCWRSDTPIMYRAVPSWFIKVEDLIPDLLENSQKSQWVPEGVRDKRFRNWLASARDWNVSRNRYWGTPIPLWISDDGEEVVCVGSINELAELSGKVIDDLHREFVDEITIPSRQGKGVLRRTFEVFDCWFESGSMPYAQLHYPFENQERFINTFPADFISEGIDQTRGWFYTLLVLSTALFNKPPFKNVIVSGLVLASDGQKMSKRKKNYPDPMDVVHKYGADCVRCYLINSPAARGEGLCFQERGLSELTRDFFIPWFNIYRFFRQYVAVYETDTKSTFSFSTKTLSETDSSINQWLLSLIQTLIFQFRNEMDAYRLYSAFPLLRNFIEALTKWYIRMNRISLRGDFGIDSQFQSLNVLYHALYQFCHISAPLCPFLSEYYFKHLQVYSGNYICELSESVHFEQFPVYCQEFRRPHIEQVFSDFCSVVELGRIIRERNCLASKHPLSELLIIHPDQEFLNRVKQLEEFILEDLNVKTINYSSDHTSHGLKLSLEPNYPLLGKRFRANLTDIKQKLNEFSQDKLLSSVIEGCITVGNEKISSEEVRVTYKKSSDSNNYRFDLEARKELAILLDIKPSSELVKEGLVRDFINRIQRLRKKSKISPTDDIYIYYSIESSDTDKSKTILDALTTNSNLLEKIIKKPVLIMNPEVSSSHNNLLADETFELENINFKLFIFN